MATCRSCGAEINWIKTKRGKNMPVDPEEVEWGDAENNDVLVSELGDVVHVSREIRDPHPNLRYYISHFATCPQGDDWRKNESREPQN